MIYYTFVFQVLLLLSMTSILVSEVDRSIYSKIFFVFTLISAGLGDTIIPVMQEFLTWIKA